MKLTTDKIKDLLTNARKAGHDMIAKDLSYCILLMNIEDVSFVYQSVFGKTEDNNVISTYDTSRKIQWMKNILEDIFPSQVDVDIDNAEGILSNEENAAGLEKLLKDLEKWRKDGEITYKDYASLSVQTRAKLANMNGSKLRVDEQYIHVYSKYNTICHNCNREYERDTKNNDYNICPHCHIEYKPTK